MMNNRSFFSEKNGEINSDIKVSIVIPWRPTDSRMKAFNLINDWYRRNFPEYNIILSDCGSDKFNLSKSRNLGMKKAFDEGSDVVVLSDADVFVSVDSLIESINNSNINKCITNPYTIYIELNSNSTDMFFNQDRMCMGLYSWISEVPKLINGKPSSLVPCSGINVIPRSVWNDIDGFDENFVGWGYEDNAYFLKYYNQYGKIYDFINGLAISVYHEKEWALEGNGNEKYFNEKYLNKKGE